MAKQSPYSPTAISPMQTCRRNRLRPKIPSAGRWHSANQLAWRLVYTTAQDLQLLVENNTVKDETINGNTWFRLTSTNGNSILIPGTGYIDDSDNVEKWATEAYLQSSTIGVYTSKPTIHALRVAKSGASLINSAGRPTGLMVRPVKYVRVD